MHIGFKIKILAGFVLALLVTSVVNYLNYDSAGKLIESSHSVEHAYQVINLKKRLMADLTKTESDVRGFVVSGNIDFLEDYEQTKKHISDTLSELKNLVKNAEQQALLKKAGPLVNKKLEHIDGLVLLVSQGKREEALESIAVGRGKGFMDEIELVFSDFSQNEFHLLNERIENNEKNARMVNRANVLFFIFTLLLVIVGGWFILREHSKNVLLNQELQFKEKQLFTFLDKVPIGILVLEKSGNIIFLNTKGQQILGEKFRNKVNINYLFKEFNITNSKNNKFAYEELPCVKALKGNSNFTDDFIMQLQGKELNLEVFSSPILDEKGEIEYAISAFLEISERKETESALKKAKELAENLLKTQEKFIANISHEIRTPMNAIIGFANLLARTRLENEQRDYTLYIKNSAESLLTIINDVLDFSKIEAGMIKFEDIPFSIFSLTDSLNNLLAYKAKEKSLNFNVTCEDNLPKIVSGDPTRLTQVLINLAGNAIKFTEKGSVTVNIRQVSKKSENVWIEIRVQDTGIGIPENKTHEIFERFAQVSDETTRKFGGTGLGLSIVKNLVELQGGSIKVESIENKGSVFTCLLPFKEVDDLRFMEKSKSNDFDLKPLANKKILLVEDNFMNQKLALAVLNNFGFNVTIAGNGEEAIKKLQEDAFDLILMDMQMPVMDGYTASEIIRDKISREVPIMAMTAHAMAGEREKCLSYGMNEYISKPFNERELYSKIINLLNPGSPGKEEEKEASHAFPEKLINLDYLKEMSFSNPAFVKDMLETFVTDASLYKSELVEAVEKMNFKAIKAISHTLKSNVSFLGIDIIYNMLEQMQQYAGTERKDMDYKVMVKEIENLLNRAIVEAKTKLGENA